MKVKKKLFERNVLVEMIGKTYFFKVILILSFASAFYGAMSFAAVDGMDLFTSLLNTHSISYFNMIFFILLFLNTINNCRTIFSNYNYVIRIKNRKDYTKKVLSTNLIVNFIWSLIFLLMYVSLLLFFNHVDLFSLDTVSYGVYTFIYTLFYILRYYLFALLLSTILCLIILRFKEKISYFFIGLFEVGLLFVSISPDIIKSFRFLPWDYFYIINYPTFSTEICYSILYCIILEIIIFVLYKICVNNSKVRVKELYFLFNDLEYTIRKNKLVILLFLLIPLVLSFSNRNLDGDYIIQSSLGLNLLSEFSYVSLVGFLTNITCCAFMFIQLFIKDYVNITNIYCRYNYEKYYYVKSIINIILLFILKFIQYVLVVGVTKFIFNKDISNIFSLFINDFSFMICVGLSIILLYVLFRIYNKFKFTLFSVIPIVVLVIFKFINLNYMFYIICSIFLIIITNFIIVKFNKKVIQEIGGI